MDIYGHITYDLEVFRWQPCHSCSDRFCQFCALLLILLLGRSQELVEKQVDPQTFHPHWILVKQRKQMQQSSFHLLGRWLKSSMAECPSLLGAWERWGLLPSPSQRCQRSNKTKVITSFHTLFFFTSFLNVSCARFKSSPWYFGEVWKCLSLLKRQRD